MRLAESAEEDAQHRVGVGRRADGRARVGAHAFLVDDDRRGQAVEHVDLGPRQRRHEALHERAVGLVDQPLRLRGDRAEHQRALARAGDAGEDRQPSLRDLDADVLEVVHACAVHADQVVAVGACGKCGQAWACLRTRLPDGSRNAQSRAPHGWDTGSWSTSAPDARTFSKVVSRSSVLKIAACSEPLVTSDRRASPSACERPPCGCDRTMSTSCPGAPTVIQRKPSAATSLRTSRPSASR